MNSMYFVLPQMCCALVALCCCILLQMHMNSYPLPHIFLFLSQSCIPHPKHENPKGCSSGGLYFCVASNRWTCEVAVYARHKANKKFQKVRHNIVCSHHYFVKLQGIGSTLCLQQGANHYKSQTKPLYHFHVFAQRQNQTRQTPSEC